MARKGTSKIRDSGDNKDTGSAKDESMGLAVAANRLRERVVERVGQLIAQVALDRSLHGHSPERVTLAVRIALDEAWKELSGPATVQFEATFIEPEVNAGQRHNA